MTAFGDRIDVSHVLARIGFRRDPHNAARHAEGGWNYLGGRRADRNVYASHAYGPALEPDWHSADQRPPGTPENGDTTWANLPVEGMRGVVIAVGAYVTKGRYVFGWEFREWQPGGRLPVVVAAIDSPGRPCLIRIDPARLAASVA